MKKKTSQFFYPSLLSTLSKNTDNLTPVKRINRDRFIDKKEQNTHTHRVCSSIRTFQRTPAVYYTGINSIGFSFAFENVSELSNSKDEAKRDRIRFVWSVRPFLSSISIPVVSSQPRVIKLKGSVISLNVAARWLGCVLKGHPANMSVLSGWSHAWNCEYTDRMANRGSVYRTEKTGQRFLPPTLSPPPRTTTPLVSYCSIGIYVEKVHSAQRSLDSHSKSSRHDLRLRYFRRDCRKHRG